MEHVNKEWQAKFFPRLARGGAQKKYVSPEEWEVHLAYVRSSFQYGDIMEAGVEELAGYLLILANAATLSAKATDKVPDPKNEILASVVRQLLQARISQEQETRSLRLGRLGIVLTIVLAVAACVQATTGYLTYCETKALNHPLAQSQPACVPK